MTAQLRQHLVKLHDELSPEGPIGGGHLRLRAVRLIKKHSDSGETFGGVVAFEHHRETLVFL
jgi:hypothetical protein